MAEISEKLHAGESIELDRYTEKHPELAEELRRVLPALEVLADLANRPPSNDVSKESLSEDRDHVHGTLGDCQIIREIGRGGMSVIYEAQQISLSRKVALKVLAFAAMLDRRQLARFQNEARAAASLDHPNIVNVYSVGCERGVHYYAMRYIEGVVSFFSVVSVRSIWGSPPSPSTLINQEAVVSLMLAQKGFCLTIG